jgi:diaminobutyrate-2-oxoglutarate transaminase
MTTTLMGDRSIFERRESQVRSYCRSFPAVFTQAENAELTDSKGRKYIDFLAGCSSLNYGHNDPDMRDALVDYVSDGGIVHGLDMHTGAKARFLETFERLILQPRSMDYRVMFTGPTGTNAVEAALKLARKKTGRTNVIAFTNGFHGVTLGALAATGNTYHRSGAGIALSGVSRFPFDGAMGKNASSAEYLRQMVTNAASGLEKPAAIIVETVQGEGGLNAASADWLREIEAIARDQGALFVIDDIQAGCGRTGAFFSFEDMGIRPDIVTLAKSLSGFGLPMAAVLVKPECDIFGPAEHNGTFRGNNHAFVTATVALEKFWADGRLAHRVRELSGIAESRLAQMSGFLPAARLKGRGMMRGIDVGDGKLAGEICARCFAQGLIIETSGADDEVVKVLAPLTIEHDTFDRGLDILESVIVETVNCKQEAAE